MAELELKKYYICYIDILGYKEHMNNMGEGKFLNILHEAYTIAIRDINIMSKPTHSNANFIYKIFSDNLVVCTECNRIDSLYSLFYLVYILQRHFIDSHNLYLRGSITEGLLYIDQEYIFGSGLVQAYKLENNIAIYPRIILDKVLNINEVINSYSEILFCIDGDGYYFIDYLVKRANDPKPLYKNHKIHVINKLKEYKNNEVVYQKYLWCKEYHNRSCIKYNLKEMTIE